MHNPRKPERRNRPPRGTTALEVFVALTLLSGVLTISTSLIVKHGRLLAAQRDYRLALDEISNQLERLTSLSDGELSQAVEQLAPSEFAASRLAGVQLRGQFEAVEIGKRLMLSLSWDEPERSAAPIVLVAWIVPDSPAVSSAPTGSQQP